MAQASDRDPYPDALRACALLVVVLGHWVATLPRLADGQLAIRVNGELAPFCRDIVICPGELVFSCEHRLTLFPEGRG